MEQPLGIKVLLIDDNNLYRAAFRRNLELNDYVVVEAENGDEALRAFETDRPDIVVTDLSMRTPLEGLDVIRSVKQADPLAPVVMISAVGTFEEGAEAQSLGAARVLSKARIEDHIEELYQAIDRAAKLGREQQSLRLEIEGLAATAEDRQPETIQRLRELSADGKLHPMLRGEAYDALLRATETDNRQRAVDAAEQVGDDVLAELTTRVPGIVAFSEDSLRELRNAEFLFHQQGDLRPAEGADFSRNMGFSYCFAVENEAKIRLRKRLQRFLGSRENIELVQKLIDPKTRKLDLFFHQYLVRLNSQIPFDFTVENVRHVLARILDHEARYKPDGLKAIGIMIVCFGRDYMLRTMKESLRINNPFGIKGYDKDIEVLRFAHLLVSLQHYRNPYIHPEISEMEKVSKIRDTAIECLKELSKVTP